MKGVILFLDEEKPFSEYSRYLPLVSEKRRERIARMAKDGDRKRSLFAELLIRDMASKQLRTVPEKLEIKNGEYGKPFIADHDDYDFSVSHSAGAVAFADGFSAVGVDIELIRPRKVNASERFFAANELEFIKTHGNSDEAFFEIWTKKEAYSKMLGKGLAAGFGSFDVTDESLGCGFFTKIIDGYAFSVCSRENLDLLKFAEMTETDLIERLSEWL
ncbi:MAG: 4'-phosphopantetheinyl transferase family protein [Oscillospiraceae bacterium]